MNDVVEYYFRYALGRIYVQDYVGKDHRTLVKMSKYLEKRLIVITLGHRIDE